MESEASFVSDESFPSTESEDSPLHHESEQRAIILHECQRGNPVLDYFQETPIVITNNIAADFLGGPGVPIVFCKLSEPMFEILEEKIKYTDKHVHGSQVRSKVLLCWVDKLNEDSLSRVTMLAFENAYSLICAKSDYEAANYIETLFKFQNKSDEDLQKKVTYKCHKDRLIATLCALPGVDRPMAISLIHKFKSLAGIFRASKEEIQEIRGVGPAKFNKFWTALHGSD